MSAVFKRTLALMLVLSTVIFMSACGNGAGDATKSDASKDESVQEAKTDESSEPEAEPSTQPEQASEEEPSKEVEQPKKTKAAKELEKRMELPENEGINLVQDMKIGWNLGNAFDAIDCNWLSDELEYESAWNGAKTTKELIVAIKEAGFNTVRIPVSWHNHVLDKTDYTISPQWLDRVAEVVDYCMEEDLYVIVNIHHDNNTNFLYPTKEYLDQSKRYVTSIWKQVSAKFADYNDHLLFGGMNEPRLVGHENEWWLNDSDDCKEAVECINKLNQAFVDTVRASGGNNATRFLICPGYCASPDGALNEGFVFPTDPVDNDHHIILSVHAYSPYNFALESPGTSTWSSSDTRNVLDMVGFMNQIYDRYVKNGTPVIIDEFGAMNKGENTDQRVDFASYYIASARARGMSCIWWDNNATKGDGELFGLIDRASCKWQYPEIVEAMMEYAQ